MPPGQGTFSMLDIDSGDHFYLSITAEKPSSFKEGFILKIEVIVNIWKYAQEGFLTSTELFVNHSRECNVYCLYLNFKWNPLMYIL